MPISHSNIVRVIFCSTFIIMCSAYILYYTQFSTCIRRLPIWKNQHHLRHRRTIRSDSFFLSLFYCVLSIACCLFWRIFHFFHVIIGICTYVFILYVFVFTALRVWKARWQKYSFRFEAFLFFLFNSTDRGVGNRAVFAFAFISMCDVNMASARDILIGN